MGPIDPKFLENNHPHQDQEEDSEDETDNVLLATNDEELDEALWM